MYNSSNIAEKIKSYAKVRKISVKQLLIDVGLGKNTMGNFKTSMPKADNLACIADYLDCSVDYLLGRTDNPLSHKQPCINSDSLKKIADEIKSIMPIEEE